MEYTWSSILSKAAYCLSGDHKLSTGEFGEGIFKYSWSGWPWRWICSNGICYLGDRCCKRTKDIRWRGYICKGNVSDGNKILPLCSQVFLFLSWTYNRWIVNVLTHWPNYSCCSLILLIEQCYITSYWFLILVLRYLIIPLTSQ